MPFSALFCSAFLSLILLPVQNLHSLMLSNGLDPHTDAAASLNPVPLSNRSHLLATDFPATTAPL